MSSSHDITLTPQEQALIMRLKSFRVPEMAHILEEQMKDPNADLNTFMERMTAMVDAEWQARADKRFNRLMKEAHLSVTHLPCDLWKAISSEIFTSDTASP